MGRDFFVRSNYEILLTNLRRNWHDLLPEVQNMTATEARALIESGQLNQEQLDTLTLALQQRIHRL